jgi:hypothetical protein
MRARITPLLDPGPGVGDGRLEGGVGELAGAPDVDEFGR